PVRERSGGGGQGRRSGEGEGRQDRRAAKAHRIVDQTGLGSSRGCAPPAGKRLCCDAAKIGRQREKAAARSEAQGTRTVQQPDCRRLERPEEGVSMRAIATDQAPKAIGPYSQAIEASGRMIFCSGQIALDPASGEL